MTETDGDDWAAWVTEATAAVRADLARQCDELATGFLAGCSPHEWGRVVAETARPDVEWDRGDPLGTVRAVERVRFRVVPVADMAPSALGAWFPMTLAVRQHLATKGVI